MLAIKLQVRSPRPDAHKAVDGFTASTCGLRNSGRNCLKVSGDDLRLLFAL
jgi:hypothetical protein